MMYLEYDWTSCVYRPRFGNTFTAFRGLRSFDSLQQAKDELALASCKLGRKTDSRTWEIVAIDADKAPQRRAHIRKAMIATKE